MLDLRLPIGYFFLLNALLLIFDGLAQPHVVALSGHVFNLDIVWGCVMAVFGASMLALAFAERRKGKS